jgi:hypothetical protein
MGIVDNRIEHIIDETAKRHHLSADALYLFASEGSEDLILAFGQIA